MDEGLSREKHVDSICSKVSADIGAKRRVKTFVPRTTLEILYNAIVQPYFNNCCPLWNNCGVGLRDKLQK